MIRALQLYPTKLLGVIADHGEFPIERLKLDRSQRWLGSASHDEVLKLTDVKDALEESDDEAGKGKEAGGEDDDEEVVTDLSKLGSIEVHICRARVIHAKGISKKDSKKNNLESGETGPVSEKAKKIGWHCVR